MFTYSDIKNYVEVYGWKGLFTIPFRRTLFKVFVIERGTRYYFIPDHVPEKKTEKSINVRRATANDLSKLTVFKRDITLYRNWLDNNDIFIIALIDEKVVGQVCITNNLPKEILSMIKFELKPNEAYAREAFIHPKYRNLGIYSMIFYFAAKMAERQGYSKVYGDIASNNQKSIKIHTKKFGLIPVFSYIHFKFLFFEKTWISVF
jgi:hypothetical protein